MEAGPVDPGGGRFSRRCGQWRWTSRRTGVGPPLHYAARRPDRWRLLCAPPGRDAPTVSLFRENIEPPKGGPRESGISARPCRQPTRGGQGSVPRGCRHLRPLRRRPAEGCQAPGRGLDQPSAPRRGSRWSSVGRRGKGWLTKLNRKVSQSRWQVPDLEWDDEDGVRQMISKTIPDCVAQDIAVRNACEHSDRRTPASNTTRRADLFKRFLDADTFKDWLTRTVLDLSHRPARGLRSRHEGIATP